MSETAYAVALSSYQYEVNIFTVGNGDGILDCRDCRGLGTVPTRVSSSQPAPRRLQPISRASVPRDMCACARQSGGAGVPFYVGNARCPTCAGQGFCPCPMCVGYRLPMPKPDPVEGPPPAEPADVLVSTQRWLRGFPDSRTPAHAAAPDSCSGSSGAGEGDAEELLTALPEEAVQELCAEAAFNFYAWRARLDGRSRPVRR